MSTAPQTPVARGVATPGTILVVDDEEVMRDVLERLLVQAGSVNDSTRLLGRARISPSRFQTPGAKASVYWTV